MASNKSEFLDLFFNQIESQVQFGDSKAQLLVAGDAILLALSADLIKFLSGCHGDDFSISCIQFSPSLALAITAAAFLAISLVCALLAARPAPIHDAKIDDDAPLQLLLFSHIARMEREVFAKEYLGAPSERLIQEALMQIHGKARYAKRKFHLLKKAIDNTLVSLGFMVASLAVGIISR